MEKSMKKEQHSFVENLAEMSAKIAANRYIGAIRDGMSATIPLVIIGSFFVLFMNLPIDAFKAWVEPYRTGLALVSAFTSDFMAIFVVIGIASSLAGYYEMDKVTAISTAIVAFLISCVQIGNISEGVAAGIELSFSGNVMALKNLGATGLFTGMLTTIFTVEVIRYFNQKNLTIKMPKAVPASVFNSFAVLIPSIVALLVLWAMRTVFNIDINEVIRTVFSPLSVFAGNSYFAVIVPILVISLFWLLGIHGMVIVTPILTPLWYEQLLGNQAALTAGQLLPNIVPEQFFQWFIWIGGAGTTLSLVLVMALFAKSQFLKQFWKFTIIPSIFNINEPVMFGLPIIMNPLFAIPFVLAPLATGTLTYFAMYFNLVGRAVAVVPWTLPAPIGAWMSTNFSFAAVVLCIINIIIAMIVYYPFVKMYDAKMVKEEQELGE